MCIQTNLRLQRNKEPYEPWEEPFSQGSKITLIERDTVYNECIFIRTIQID